jgi:serine/threonine-protein phosphatase 2B catalytic subunit
MLIGILNVCSKEELEDASEEQIEKEQRRQVIRNKILAIGRLSRVFHVLREESESISELKSVSGSSKLPMGTLLTGAEGIRKAITSFEEARKSDLVNERLPPQREEIDAMQKDEFNGAVERAKNTQDSTIENIAKRLSY